MHAAGGLRLGKRDVYFRRVGALLELRRQFGDVERAVQVALQGLVHRRPEQRRDLLLKPAHLSYRLINLIEPPAALIN